jgi:hypothetical protein
MEEVAHCVHKLATLFEAVYNQDLPQVRAVCQEIQSYEHEADRTKNDIRNHLPKSLFMPINRGQLLEILSMQDTLADNAEDISVLCSLKELTFFPGWKEVFDAFLKKNLECFDEALNIIKELHDLLESSFGGVEAEKVITMVERVAFTEHEADMIQRKLLSLLFNSENELSVSTFFLWQNIFEKVGEIANISEALANRVRMTLELK